MGPLPPQAPFGVFTHSKPPLICHPSSVQPNSVSQSCPTPCKPMDCSTPGFPIHYQLPELIQTHVHRVTDAIQLSHSLSSPSPPALNLSQNQGLFQWVSSSHQVAKVLSFSFSICPSNEYSELISLRMDWFDLLPVQGTLKSLLQHHSSKASILRGSAFFIVPLLLSIRTCKTPHRHQTHHSQEGIFVAFTARITGMYLQGHSPHHHPLLFHCPRCQVHQGHAFLAPAHADAAFCGVSGSPTYWVSYPSWLPNCLAKSHW